MSLTFIATASRKSDGFIIESVVSVYQQIAGNSQVPVAYIYDSADPGDHRMTRIVFAEGVLHFSAAYDGPLQERFVWEFTDENHRSTDVSLHSFTFAKQAFLRSSDGVFLIVNSVHRDAFELQIYQSPSKSGKDGQNSFVLATIAQTKKLENGFVYEIQVEKAIPIRLLMAIFSLPFTLLNIA